MNIKRFFFPKNFVEEMQKGQIGGDIIISAGRDRVSRHKHGKFFYGLFSWLPMLGNLVFYLEGKRELRDIELKAKRRKSEKKHR